MNPSPSPNIQTSSFQDRPLWPLLLELPAGAPAPPAPPAPVPGPGPPELSRRVPRLQGWASEEVWNNMEQKGVAAGIHGYL